MQSRHAQLIASSHAFAELKRDCKENVLKHAYIFESSDFAALETLSAMFISCAEYGEVSEFVLKRVFDGGYIDIVRVPSAEKNGKMDVEDAAYITDTAYFTPTELKTKYYIIAAENGMSAPVQNKLLKTLEEPPSSARFIIFTAGGDLLPTVSSRCSSVRLEEFSVEDIERELINVGTDELTALFSAAVARGNIGYAEKIASDSGYRRAYESAMNFLLNVKRSPQILPAAGSIIAEKEKFGAFVDYLELIFRDIMVYRECGASAIVLKPAAGDILTLSREYDTRTCLALMPLLTRARDRMRLYGNAASCADELLFSILEVKSKCLK